MGEAFVGLAGWRTWPAVLGPGLGTAFHGGQEVAISIVCPTECCEHMQCPLWFGSADLPICPELSKLCYSSIGSAPGVGMGQVGLWSRRCVHPAIEQSVRRPYRAVNSNN